MSIKILFANVIDKKNFSSLTGNSIVSFSILFNFSGDKAIMSVEITFVGFICFSCGIIGVFPIVAVWFFNVQNAGE